MAFYNELNSPSNFATSFHREPKYDFGFFAQGYKFAADLIANKLLEGHFPDYQAYPVVFLYRHALELQLKNIIYSVARLLSFTHIEDIDDQLYISHDLSDLSKKAYNVIIKAFPDNVPLHKTLENVVRVAKEFSEIDPDSFGYRYPIDRKGNYSTQRDQMVNLESLATHMDNLLSELEAIDFGISIETEAAKEVYGLFESL